MQYSIILAALAATALSAPSQVESGNNYGSNGMKLTGPVPVASDDFLNFAIITAPSTPSNTAIADLKIVKVDPPLTVNGFDAPIALSGAINVPLDPITNQDTYMGGVYYPFGTNSAIGEISIYDPSVCASVCSARAGSAGNNPARCNQAVSFILRNNSAPLGQYCTLYTESWASAHGVNVGQWRGADYFSVTDVYYYINSTYASSYAPICAASNCPAHSYQGGSCGGNGGKC